MRTVQPFAVLLGLFFTVGAFAQSTTGTPVERLEVKAERKWGLELRTEHYSVKGDDEAQSINDVDSYLGMSYKLSPTSSFSLRQQFYIESQFEENSKGDTERDYDSGLGSIIGEYRNSSWLGAYNIFRLYTPVGDKRRDSGNTEFRYYGIWSTKFGKSWDLEYGTNPRLYAYVNEQQGGEKGADLLNFGELYYTFNKYLKASVVGGVGHQWYLQGAKDNNIDYFLADWGVYVTPVKGLKFYAYVEQFTDLRKINEDGYGMFIEDDTYYNFRMDLQF